MKAMEEVTVKYFVVCRDMNGKWKWHTLDYADSRECWAKVNAMAPEWKEEGDTVTMYYK